MEQVVVQLPDAVATYSAKSALFSAGVSDRGTFFDCTGSFTVSFSAAATLGSGWYCWIRNVSGTQTLDPATTELINGASTYAVSNAGDVVLVECTGTAFVVVHTQRPSTVAITGGTINGTVIGGSTAAAGTFTTVTVSGLTSGRMPYVTTAGLITDSAGLTYDGTSVSVLGTTSNSMFLTKTVLGVSGGGGVVCRADDGSTVTSTGDRLMILAASGRRDGSTLTSASAVTSFATEVWGASAAGSDVRIETTPNGSTTRSSSLTITSSNATFATTVVVTIAKTTGTTLVVSSTDDSNSVSLDGGMTIASGKNLRMGTANIAVTGTTGFPYIPVCTGTPTGTPTTLAGTAPLVIDTTNNKLYFYSSGAWRDAGP
jgi:hypothetical protein